MVFYLLLYLLSSVLIETRRFCTLFVDLFVGFAFVANMPKHLTLSDCRVPFLR